MAVEVARLQGHIQITGADAPRIGCAALNAHVAPVEKLTCRKQLAQADAARELCDLHGVGLLAEHAVRDVRFSTPPHTASAAIPFDSMGGRQGVRSAGPAEVARILSDPAESVKVNSPPATTARGVRLTEFSFRGYVSNHVENHLPAKTEFCKPDPSQR
jgi:hypothetical protein